MKLAYIARSNRPRLRKAAWVAVQSKRIHQPRIELRGSVDSYAVVDVDLHVTFCRTKRGARRALAHPPP